jgi:phosphatidylserine decarboxylase
MLADLFIALQRILPARLLGRLVHALSRSRNALLKDLLIRSFVRIYPVDVSEAEKDVPGGYESFNAFFTRALKPGARPPDPDPATILCPADGTIQQIGEIRGDEILQVKGIYYQLGELLGADAEAAEAYVNGSFVTIYLAPWNYHRVHMPAAGRITRMRHVAGDLWSVNAMTAERVPGLFARNERLICHCEGQNGPFAVLLIGALNVGSISTAWAGEVLPRDGQAMTEWRYDPADRLTQLGRGDLLGQFNMGSTVILLLPAGHTRWRADLQAGSQVRSGTGLGRLLPAPHAT